MSESSAAGSVDGSTGSGTRAIRRWAQIALVAHVVFVLTWLVAPLWQGPGYSVLAHTISDMYATGEPGAWVLIVVFTLCGAALIGFAARSLWPTLRPAGRPAAIGSLLLALSVYGVGDLTSAYGRLPCNQAEPGCTPAAQLAHPDGVVHSVISGAGLLLFVVALLVLAAAMRRLPDWARCTRPTGVTAVLFFALCVVTGLAGPAGLVGLSQRVTAATGAAAIVLLALAVLRRTPRPGPDSR